MDNHSEWYHVDNIDDIDSPALVIFADRVKKNIQTAISMTGDVKRLRPHIKTHKSPDVAHLMMDAGIDRFKCATIAEAELLGIAGARDVLLAYQPAGPKLKRFAELVKKYPATKYSCLVDNKDTAIEQSSVFAASGLTIPVYIDLNVGMNRTGIAPGASAIELYEFCNTLKGVQPVGLHAYDGHIHGTPYEQRKRECDAAFLSVVSMQQELVKKGIKEPVIVAGGSHSFSVHCKRSNVECSPGTFVYWDKNNIDACPEQDFLAAAIVVSRIISLPGDDLVCTDLGHKSVAAEKVITRRVYFLNAPELEAVSQSEEHLVLRSSPEHTYKAGDILYGLPGHVCPTIALYESAWVVENGKAGEVWQATARNRKISV